MKIIDVSRPPKEIWLGRDGENNWRPIAFECATLLAKRPDGIITVWMEANSSKFPLSAVMDGTKAVWYPQQEELFLGGSRIEVSIQSGDDVGTSAIIDCRVDESLIGNGEHPAQEMPPWGVEVVANAKENADRAEAAVEHYPKIVNGIWHVWDATQSEFVSTGINAQGEDGVSPTVTVTEIEGGHRVTITDTDGAHTFDVMDGEGSQGGAVDSVNGRTGVVVLDASDVGALPDDTQIPSKTSDLTNDSGYQTAQDVQAAISGVRQLPTGGSMGDFLRKDTNGNAAWETLSTWQGGSY